MKKISILFAVLILNFSTSEAQVNSFRRQIAKQYWIPFTWEGGTLGGRRFDKLAIFVGGQLNDIPRPFGLQFDTGSNLSSLNGGTVESLKKYSTQYTSIPDLSDKSKEGYQSVKLKMYPNGPTLNKVWVNNNYGDPVDSNDYNKNQPIQIGSWGADVCQNKVLVIDFQKQKMSFLNELPQDAHKAVDFVDIEIKNNRPHIPVTINGKKYYLLYDSGASLFPIMTVKKYWDVINPVAITDTVKRVSTWGKYSDVYGAKMQSEVRLGNTILKPKVIYYHPDPYKHHEPIFDEAGVIGSFGNSYFFDRVVVIDFKNKRFGLVKE